MKFHCERALFLGGISIASRTVAPKSTIPALEGLLIEAREDCLIITGYNLKTGIRTRIPADVEEPGRLVLSAKLLGDIVRKMPEGSVSVTVENSLLVKLTCSMSYFEIMGSQPEDFPELPSVDAENALRISEKKLQELIGQTIFAVSTNESRPVHTGSLFEVEEGKLTVVSVDGYRLALRREELEGDSGEKLSFVVPGAALSEVKNIASDSEEAVTIHLGSRHIMFSMGDTELISRRLEGEFLDYRRSIPAQGKYEILGDRRSLLSAFERVSLVINEKYKSPVRCRFEDGAMKLSSTTAIGKATDECPVDGDGEGLEIGFNNRYVMDALRAAPAEELKILLSSAVSPCVLLPADGSDSFVYLILPVRIRAEE